MLDEKLVEYAQSDIYPFHMPGHKRQAVCEWNPYELDITEIDGFDNLHRAEGILKEAQERAAGLYGARQSFYLVNGSTCGLLAAICAATKRRQKVLVARNCHKAVYHALSLWELDVDYIYPELAKTGVLGQITVEQVEKACSAEKDYAAVILTSPTYDGVVSDIAGIAKVVHAHGIPLIVDEAHGAHFGLSEYFPKSAVTEGADLVIQSMHKTLPSFTQTALLHVCSERVPADRVAEFLDIFETSSPSYVFMAGMDRCIRLLKEQGSKLFDTYWSRLSDFYRSVKNLRHIHVVCPADFTKEEAYAFDCSKILIFPDSSVMTGKRLYDLLLHRYGLQMEMASLHYVLAMTSVMDTEQGFARLSAALHKLDDSMDRHKGEDGCEEESVTRGQISHRLNQIYVPQQQAYAIATAQEKEKEAVSPEAAAGRISAGYVYLYPPGIPLLAPGEYITAENIQDIEYCSRTGLEIYGLSSRQIWAVKE